jgi:CBS domain containing-hemolysin-like protein
MEWTTDPTIWIGLVTLVLLEIVLGIDNLIFIAILVGRLPQKVRERARVIGLSVALLLRLALLASISWVMSLTQPVLSVWGHGFSWRDLILIGGGLFLLIKATIEMHDRLEASGSDEDMPAAAAGFWPVVAQIVVLDVVFSLDSVITAVGLIDEVYLMMAAVVIAVIVMLLAAKPVTTFITNRPSLIVLCLGFLLMIGLVLVVDGLGIHVPKSYVYAAIGFSVIIEALNQRAAHNRRRFAARIPPRRRAARAILRMIGGVPLSAHDGHLETQSGSADGGLALEGGGSAIQNENVFAPLERRMVRGVLDLARRPVTAIMTPRPEVDWIDAAAGREVIHEQVRASPYRVFPVGDGALDNLLGVARKEDLLAHCMQTDRPFELGKVLLEPTALPATATALRALELFKRAPVQLAVVADEYGGIAGVLTRTDLLEAITGDLPEFAGEPPEVEQLADGAWSFDGALPLTDLQERLQLASLPEGPYQTAAGMVLLLLGRIAKRGDSVEWGGWKFEVAEMEGFGITRLVARRVERAE